MSETCRGHLWDKIIIKFFHQVGTSSLLILFDVILPSVFGSSLWFLVRVFHLNIFLTVLVSGILCTWANQLSLWSLIQLNNTIIIFMEPVRLFCRLTKVIRKVITFVNWQNNLTGSIRTAFKVLKRILHNEIFQNWIESIAIYLEDFKKLREGFTYLKNRIIFVKF